MFAMCVGFYHESPFLYAIKERLEIRNGCERIANQKRISATYHVGDVERTTPIAGQQ